jgi:hypothetical protein
LPAPALRIPLLTVAAALLLAASAAAKPYPETIGLSAGWQPEGIANQGRGRIIVHGHEGGGATGMKVDRRGRLFVSGAGTGTASVYTGPASSCAATG